MSNTATVARISDDTHSHRPSRENTASRGRVPTITLSTSTRSRASMKCTRLAVSDVQITHLPSGLVAMPSGSAPTATSATIFFAAM